MVPGPSPPHPPEGVAGRDAPADGRPEGASGAPPAQDDGIALEGLVPQGADLLPADRARLQWPSARPLGILDPDRDPGRPEEDGAQARGAQPEGGILLAEPGLHRAVDHRLGRGFLAGGAKLPLREGRHQVRGGDPVGGPASRLQGGGGARGIRRTRTGALPGPRSPRRRTGGRAPLPPFPPEGPLSPPHGQNTPPARPPRPASPLSP